MTLLPPAALRAAVGRALGRTLDWSHARSVSGGSICRALTIPGPGAGLFLKWLPDAPSGFFEAEAEGLTLLGAAVPVPSVLAIAHAPPAAALALTYHEPSRPSSAAAQAAGEALARLHAIKANDFGAAHDNFMGRLPQRNLPIPGADFSTFYRERRLSPHLDLLPPELVRAIERLPLGALLDDATPTLVHGDLWSGNLLFTPAGPLFIDPAAHFGHPLADLAMMRLFGGLPREVEASWRAARGLGAADLDDRVALLQLYPLLIHLRLFGAGWLADIAHLLRRFD